MSAVAHMNHDQDYPADYLAGILKSVKTIAMGEGGAVTTDDQAYCWGDGDFGQLGVRSILDFDVPRQVFRGVILP